MRGTGSDPAPPRVAKLGEAGRAGHYRAAPLTVPRPSGTP